MKTLITICARGGSKGIPGKNVRELAGRPLIAYTIDHAQEYARRKGGDIALSTDDPEIKQIAAKCGLETDYVRPAKLSTDQAGKEAAMRDILEYEEGKRGERYDLLLDLDVTSPMRTVEELEGAYDQLMAQPDAINLYSVSPARRNPYFNMVEQHEDGYHRLIKAPKIPILSRQVAPKVYDVNASFYFYRRAFFDEGHKTPFTDRSIAYVMHGLCFDLDDPTDFAFLEWLVEHKRAEVSL